MSPLSLRLLEDVSPAPLPSQPRKPLGRHLVDSGIITSDQLVQALQMQLRLRAPIGEILVSEGWAASDDIQEALARQHGLQRADLVAQPPDAALCETRPYQFWLKHRAIPWMQVGEMALVATARPDDFAALKAELGDGFGIVLPALASDAQIAGAIARQFREPLAVAAGARVAARFSCRTWQRGRGVALAALLVGLAAVLIAAPLWCIAALSLLATATLLMFTALKLGAFVAHLLSHRHLTAPGPDCVALESGYRLPKVSVLVPLFRETEIAGHLIRRLGRLTYPKALLDVVLVLEEADELTRETLARTELPAWIRVAEVPAHGALTTKPRAMNYALDFTDGEIVGVWDAEDAPAADQIEQVVAHFAQAPADVVCLQGILDYYNPHTNWLARCFTIEYASWFRIVLPGIARMGLVVPLGGTTLFFKRRELEELGGWDAHNVTEDADLGVRLCRAGYRTEMIETVTYEEANCRVWPWIRQRSRWLKGFMVTYLVHMRSPARLWSELGPRRFWSLQAFFLGTICQFLLAPVLWSFWLLVLGFGHPVEALAPPTLIPLVAGIFLLTELLAICIGLVAVSSPERRFLMRWVPTLMFYFPLGVFAAYKALYELLARPYFWDKTQHGQAAAQIAIE